MPLTNPIDLSQGPRRLSHYVLLERLGQGGMGVVYAAYDERLDRKVAIKLLHSSDHEKDRLRLRREAQSLARLSHPNVVQIYEIGEHEDLDYLVMEMVDGVTLGQWSKASQRAWTEVLVVYSSAGRGLVAAHAKGIIHRDFKPTNAMVRADGQGLVMDFGLARHSDRALSLREAGVEPPDREWGPGSERGAEQDSDLRSRSSPPLGFVTEAELGLTRVGAVMGTLGYMAPEQARGQVADARSDQFSFCAALWEALYGRRPFGASTLDRYVRNVLTRKLRLPERSEVPSWLRIRLERGLAADPRQRWKSMDDLLDALQRDPTRRRRQVVASLAGLGFVVALVAGGLLSNVREREREVASCENELHALDGIWNESVQAQLQAAFLATGASSAVDTWERTDAWLDFYARELVEQRRITCLESRVEETRSEDSARSVVECLDEQAANFSALLEVLAEIDATGVTSAVLAATSLPRISQCGNEAWLARSLRAPTELREPIRDLRGRLLRVRSLILVGEFDSALAAASRLTEDAEAVGWRPVISEAWLEIAELHFEQSRYDEALSASERAFREAAVAGDVLGMLQAATHLTRTTSALAQLDASQEWRATAQALIDANGLQGTLLDGRAALQSCKTSVLGSELDRALTEAQRGLAIFQEQLGPEHPRVAFAHSNIGAIHFARGDMREALVEFEREAAILESTLGPANSHMVESWNSIGAVRQTLGDERGALTAYQRGLAVAEQSLSPENAVVGTLIGNVGFLLAARGEDDSALEHLTRSLENFKANQGANHPNTILVVVAVADLQSRRGEHELALAEFRRVAGIIGDASGFPAQVLVQFHLGYAAALERNGDVEAAIGEYELAIAIADKDLGPDFSTLTLEALLGLGDIDLDRGNLERAAGFLARARTTAGQERFHLAVVDFRQARLAWARGDQAGGRALAKAARAEIAALARDDDRPRPDELAEVDAWLASPK
jgi:tetratricopeptide (TPR) repeat protein/predicted Ser/Thr protein kinase